MSTSAYVSTGINTKKVSAMQQAIEDWANAIDAADITVSSKAITSAMKGSKQQAQIKKLCQQINSYVNTLTKELRSHEQELAQLAAGYAKNDSSSTAISNYTAAVKNLKS